MQFKGAKVGRGPYVGNGLNPCNGDKPLRDFTDDGAEVGKGLHLGKPVGVGVAVTVGVKVMDIVGETVGVIVGVILIVGVGLTKLFAVEKLIPIILAFAVNWANASGMKYKVHSIINIVNKNMFFFMMFLLHPSQPEFFS